MIIFSGGIVGKKFYAYFLEDENITGINAKALFMAKKPDINLFQQKKKESSGLKQELIMKRKQVIRLLK